MSSGRIVTDTGGEAGYAVIAQYSDLVFPAAVRDTMGAALTSLVGSVRRVVEIGSGTGQFTEVLLANLPEGGEVFAVEPADLPAPPGSGCPQLHRPAATGSAAKVSRLHSNQQRLTAQAERSTVPAVPPTGRAGRRHAGPSGP
jgi:hypothetical protein